ncbi:hypothetical protein [Nocardia lasii]|uniref:Uncharacterized protein n=1 Tax=Nocardia lasii TaxID=1616107 RepID=A0ABW1JPD6_9NOCA
MTDLPTVTSEPVPEVGDESSNAVPLFSAPHRVEVADAAPNTLARNQFPTFLAPGQPE